MHILISMESERESKKLDAFGDNWVTVLKNRTKIAQTCHSTGLQATMFEELKSEGWVSG